MGEFLGSIHLNQNNDLLISSSNLTFEKWNGCVAYIPQSSISEYCTPISTETKPTSKTSSLKLVTSASANIDEQNRALLSNMLRYKAGITRAKWALDNEHFLAASEIGHIELFRRRGANEDSNATNTNNNKDESPRAPFESVMFAREHDALIDCLETKLAEGFALTGSNDCKIKVWDLKEQMSTRTYKAHENVVCGLSLNQDDTNMFISCSIDERALLWDTRKPKPAFSIAHGLNGYPSCACWSKTYLIGLGSETGQIGVYDIRALNNADKPFYLNQWHSRLVRRIEFNGNIMASAAEDCNTYAFRLVEPSVLTDASLIQTYSFKHNDYVTDLAWLSSDEYLTCSWDGTLRHHRISNRVANGNGIQHEN